jgi:hypothetical protein
MLEKEQSRAQVDQMAGDGPEHIGGLGALCIQEELQEHHAALIDIG